MASETFDESKKYKELELVPGQFVVAEDFNHIQGVQNFDRWTLGKYQTGFTLKVNHITNTPVLKVRTNFNLTEGQILEFEMIDATHVQWRQNGGAWNGPIVVTCDNATWNAVGTSGLDVVFSDTAVAADDSEVWVAFAMRLLGGELSSPVANSFTLEEGHWQILGEYEEFADQTVVGTANDDYVYLRVQHTKVDHLTDPDIGHRLADGEYASKSPKAVQRIYTLMASAAFPANVADPFTEYVVVGKVVNAAAGTIISMWHNPMDFQRLIRLHGDEEAPTAPTGLTLTTGAESSLAHAGVKKVSFAVPRFGWLKMVCDSLNEPDIQYYEFKMSVLDAAHAVTSDTITQIVYPNTSAGGVGVPLGISYTLHNQIVGVEYRVWVRAVDFSGNVGAWSAPVDEYVGGVCTIATIAPGPTFSLIDTTNYVGFEIVVAALPATAAGFSYYVGEGAYPDPAVSSSCGNAPLNQSSVQVPWKESGHPFVRVMAFDSSGLYHVDAGGAYVYTDDNVQLASSAQLSSETHNASPDSHSGTISDVLECSTKYGSLFNWLIRLSNQGWDLENLYIVGEEGATYATVTAALNAIVLDAPTFATILVGPGAFGSGGTITIPDFYDAGLGGVTTRVAIVGLGPTTSIINADIDLVNVGISPKPVSVPMSQRYAGVYFCNLGITGYVTGTRAGATFGAVAFDNVFIEDNSVAQPLVFLDGGATGGWYVWVMNNSYFINTGSNYTLELRGDIDFYLASSKFRIHDVAGNTDCIYLTTPTGVIRSVFDCQIQVTGAVAGVVMDSSVGATTVNVAGNVLNTAWGGNIAATVGTVNTNTSLAVDFMMS